MKYHYPNLFFAFMSVATALIVSSCESGDSSGLSQDIIYERQAKLITKYQLDDIRISPTDPESDVTLTVTTGGQKQFTVHGVSNEQDVVELTNDVSWTSDDPAIASIDDRGLLVSFADGEVNVTAVLASLNKAVNVTLSSAALESIEIRADNENNDFNVEVCNKLSLKALGTYAGETTTRNITTMATWRVNAPDFNTAAFSGIVDNAIIFKASRHVDAGLEVTAEFEGVVSPIQLVNTQPYAGGTITITPLEETINDANTLLYTATSSVEPTRDLSLYTVWESGTPETANFLSTDELKRNLITALDKGATTVTATCGDVVSEGANLVVVDNTIISAALRFEGESNDIDTSEGITMSFGDIVKLEFRVNYADRDNINKSDEATWSLLGWTDENAITLDDSKDEYVKVTANNIEDTGTIRAKFGETEKTLEIRVRAP